MDFGPADHCLAVTPPTDVAPENMPTNPPAENAPMIAAGVVWTGSATGQFVKGVRLDMETALAIVNRSAMPVTITAGAAQAFYPQDTRLPPLSLADVRGGENLTVAAGQQEILVFTVNSEMLVAESDRTALNNRSVYLYYSQPASATPCTGARMELNPMRNDCVLIPATDHAECRMDNAEEPFFDSTTNSCRAPNSDADCRELDSTKPMFVSDSESSMCIAESGSGGTNPDPTPTTTVSATPSANNDDGNEELRRYGGIVGAGLLMYAWYHGGGDPSAFSFSPDFGYSATQNGYSYNYGARLNFAKDNWRMYWTAGQTNSNGEFGELRYASFAEYTADSDSWTAAFSESVQGDFADYDFALSTKMRGGIWKVSPTYRFHSRLDLEKDESDSRNSLSLDAVLQLNHWTIRPTAGFTWRRVEEFGNNARFQISAVRRF